MSTTRTGMNRVLFFPLLSFLPLLVCCKSEIEVSTTQQLLEALHEGRPLTIRLRSGAYHLSPTATTEPACGNCADEKTPVNMTVGLSIQSDGIRITGPKSGKPATIHTHAGYGIFINGAEDVLLENLVITDGVRDPDGNATDAAVVVKNGEATIRGCLITDNIGDPSTIQETVVGIMGITGREGSVTRITGNRITRNSWDGIALYRGARAVIEGNIIDGMDKAGGQRIGGGRGVGIGVTWDARAEITGNLVTRYWKGIGLFVDAHATVRENIIEDVLTWGIAYWDAGKGKPSGFIRNNVIHRTGACGISLARASPGAEPGHLIGNAVLHAGQNPAYDSPDYYCYQCALAEHAVPENFEISGNIFYGNRQAAEDLPDHDLPREEFEREILPLVEALRKHSFLARSKFMEEYGKPPR